MTGQTQGGVKRSTNTEANGRFHTDWLNMMYPRLKLAHALLSDEGLIAVHIDEHEVHALVLMLREIFGEENELGVAVWDKRNPKGDARGVAYQHESLVLFARNAETLLERAPLKRPKRNAQRMLDAAHDAVYRSGNPKDAQKAYRAWMKAQTNLSGGEVMYDRLSPEGRVYRLVSMAWPNKKKAPDEYFTPLIHPVTGKPCAMPARGWRNPPATMQALIERGQIEFGPDETTQPQRIYYLDENMYENVPSVLPFAGSGRRVAEDTRHPVRPAQAGRFRGGRDRLARAATTSCSTASRARLDRPRGDAGERDRRRRAPLHPRATARGARPPRQDADGRCRFLREAEEAADARRNHEGTPAPRRAAGRARLSGKLWRPRLPRVPARHDQRDRVGPAPRRLRPRALSRPSST